MSITTAAGYVSTGELEEFGASGDTFGDTVEKGVIEEDYEKPVNEFTGFFI